MTRTMFRCKAPAFALALLVALSTVLAPRVVFGADDDKAEKQVNSPDLLPDGTIMYAEIASWSSWSKDFSKTSLAKIFAEPEVRQFLAGPFSQISYLIKKTTTANPNDPNAPVAPKPDPKDPATPNPLSTVLDIASQLTPGPFTVAVRFSPEDAAAGRLPAVALMAGITSNKDTDSAAAMIPGILDALLHNLKVDAVAVTDYQNIKLITIKRMAPNGKELTSAITFHNGRMIVASDVSLVTQILDGMAGTLPKKLSDSDTYKNCGLVGNEHLVAFLDVAGLKSAFAAMQKPLPDAPNQVDDFFVLAGLNKSIAVAWSLRMNGPAFESRTAIFSKGEREGLLGTLDEEPLSAAALKSVPAGTPLAVAFRLRAPRILPFIRQAVKAVQGSKGLENFDAIEKQLSGELGRDLDKDMQAALGGEVVVSSLAPVLENNNPLGALSAFTVAFSVKDAAKADELVGQLLTRFAKADPKADALKELDYEGAKIRYLPNRRMAGVIEFSPSFVVIDNRLLMAVDVPSLKRAIAVAKNGPSLTDSDAFKNALAGVGGKMGPMFSYVDWGFMYKSAFNVATGALKLIAPTDVLRDIGVDMNLIPETATVSQHLFPGLSVAQITPTGIVLTSRSPLPSFEVLSPPVAAVSAVFNTFKPFLVPAPEKKEEKK